MVRECHVTYNLCLPSARKGQLKFALDSSIVILYIICSMPLEACSIEVGPKQLYFYKDTQMSPTWPMSNL
uniref:Uncharacterized protein n=1 Tax=Arundo donax TaxID=35708 RepID=A0A0A9DM89_ARUDO